MSLKAKQKYLNQYTNKINETKLLEDASYLPKRIRTWQEFKKQFDNQNNYLHDFCGYKILISLRYAYDHFTNNTYNEYRNNINGTLYPTLHEPLIVIKKYDLSKQKNVLTFYKTFYTQKEDQKKILHILMYHAIEGNDGIYRFKTIFEAHSLKKVEEIIKALDLNTVYFKFD